MQRFNYKRLLSVFMAICMMFTLLPINNMKVLADETEVEDYSEQCDETRTVSGAAITTAASGAAITMATSAVETYDVWVAEYRLPTIIRVVSPVMELAVQSPITQGPALLLWIMQKSQEYTDGMIILKHIVLLSTLRVH